jgi:hypothetical protein
LFPELLPYLQEAFDAAPDGALYVIDRKRSHETNLRTTFERIVYKAGLLPWEKPFQNMRSSRETVLAAEWPIHIVCAWIGNTAAEAAKHYLQVTDNDFQKAARCTSAAESGAVRSEKGWKCVDWSGKEQNGRWQKCPRSSFITWQRPTVHRPMRRSHRI